MSQRGKKIAIYQRHTSTFANSQLACQFFGVVYQIFNFSRICIPPHILLAEYLYECVSLCDDFGSVHARAYSGQCCRGLGSFAAARGRIVHLHTFSYMTNWLK